MESVVRGERAREVQSVDEVEIALRAVRHEAPPVCLGDAGDSHRLWGQDGQQLRVEFYS